MFGFGMPEILLILVIVVLVFGAGKLPEIGAGLGKGISNFKKSLQEGKENEKLDKHKDDSAG